MGQSDLVLSLAVSSEAVVGCTEGRSRGSCAEQVVDASAMVFGVIDLGHSGVACSAEFTVSNRKPPHLIVDQNTASGTQAGSTPSDSRIQALASSGLP